MSWTPEQRRRYAPAIGEAVRANATVRLAATIDAIDPPARTGRPRLWSTLTMLQALWWLCRAGAAWALLPGSCPPRQTIGSRLGRWVRLGVLDRALAVLNACLRLARGRTRRPSAGILDTQSVRTGPQAGPRGFDAHKKVRGRKRLLLTDTEGLVQALRVVPASIQDRDTPGLLEPEFAAGRLRKVWADLAFAGERAAARWSATASRSNWSAARTSRVSWSSRGGGRSSRPSVVSSVTGACWSITRAVQRCPAP